MANSGETAYFKLDPDPGFSKEILYQISMEFFLVTLHLKRRGPVALQPPPHYFPAAKESFSLLMALIFH